MEELSSTDAISMGFALDVRTLGVFSMARNHIVVQVSTQGLNIVCNKGNFFLNNDCDFNCDFIDDILY